MPVTISTPYVGGLSDAQKVMAYNSIVEQGFSAPFDRPQELVYPKIAAVKSPKDLGIPEGHMPKTVTFGFSPPNSKAHELITARQPRPLTMHSIELSPKIYADTLYAERKDFDTDLLNILRKVPRDLRRTEAKNPDVLLADLLRNGKTALDYTGLSNFFATGKKCSPEGQVSDTYSNLYTGRPLTESNIAYGVQQMMTIRAPDGLLLGVRPRKLVVPFSLWHDAVVATQAKSIVFTGQNPAPGQVGASLNAAAQGENVQSTILKWIEEIIVFDYLEDGQDINSTSWYLMDTNDGPVSLLYALVQPAEYTSLMSPTDPNVFHQERYYWGYRKAEAVGYGLPQYIARFEAA